MSLALVLIVICALEAWLVQAKTLLAPQAQGEMEPVIDPALRFGFDLLAFGALNGFLPRPLVAVAFMANVGFYVFALIHHDYFQQPVSILLLRNQRKEARQVPPIGAAQLRSWHLIFLGVLGLKLLLLYSAPDSTPGYRTGLICVGLYLLAMLIVNRAYKPLAGIATWETVGGLGAVYGYIPALVAEYACLDSKTLLIRALARAHEVSDQLTPVETPAPIADRLVFLQIESLDWAILHFKVKGLEVTPELNRLARRGMTYAVQAEKLTGPLDADFAMLMGRAPSADVPTYKIQGYPYSGSLVEKLREMGFATTAVYGGSGDFFSRRPAFEAMGFDRLIFREEFDDLAAAPVSGWSIPDDELLQFAAMDFSAQSGRQFELAITATSHAPFHNYDRKLARFFPGATGMAENYFDVINYVDRAVGRFLEALPQETTVVLYGDHTSKVQHDDLGYRQSTRDGVGLVPFMVLETGRDLSRLQRTGESARDGHLTLLDAVGWVHSSITLVRDGT